MFIRNILKGLETLESWISKVKIQKFKGLQSENQKTVETFKQYYVCISCCYKSYTFTRSLKIKVK